MISQSLMRRKPKADVGKLFVGILSRDKKKRPTTLLVPGSEAKRYHVILRRKPNLITAECRLDTSAGHLPCPGNSYHRGKPQATICYHSRAAIDRAVEDAGYKAYWCQTKSARDKVIHLTDGRPITVQSHQNGATAYIVVVKK